MTLPGDELIKSMFTQFGITYYDSEVLCTGLSIFYALMSFKDANDITKPRIEEKLVEAGSLTLGHVIDKVKPFVSVDLQIDLDKALEKRNYLAHHFWYDHAYSMFDEAGLTEMINELRQSKLMFEELDNQIEGLLTQRRIEIGVTDEIVREQFQKGLGGEVEPQLPAKRPLSKKDVRIVRAYDIYLADKVTAQVFEAEDGQILQFCDVGLGWSIFTEAKPDWKINEVLQPYLPANLVPRPQITDAWNYEFTLPQKAVLWVKRGKAEKTYRWGIRTHKKQIR